MNERKGIITFGGDPVTLIGEETKVGSKVGRTQIHWLEVLYEYFKRSIE